MITRIVKLEISTPLLQSFMDMFHSSKTGILDFTGCRSVELLQEESTPDKTTFFTYSIWETKEDLERYRSSDFFRGVWTETKKHFCGRPEAWTTQKVG
jgi:heme-degrading monooxygenase HmoA